MLGEQVLAVDYEDAVQQVDLDQDRAVPALLVVDAGRLDGALGVLARLHSAARNLLVTAAGDHLHLAVLAGVVALDGGDECTGDLRAGCVAAGVRAGVVWVNDHHKNDPRSVWGGWGESGYGKENGWAALKEHQRKRSIIVRTAPGFDDWFGGGTQDPVEKLVNKLVGAGRQSPLLRVKAEKSRDVVRQQGEKFDLLSAYEGLELALGDE